MRLSELEGMPVLSRESAERIGRVRNVVVRADEARIAALHVDGRRRSARLVDWEALTGVGPDAVVVRSERALRPPEGDDELRAVGGGLVLRGRLLLTDAGNARGRISEVEFDERDGRIRTFVTERGEHDGHRLRTVGPYCVIVRA